jgi:hypothetical protein
VHASEHRTRTGIPCDARRIGIAAWVDTETRNRDGGGLVPGGPLMTSSQFVSVSIGSA